VKFWPWCRCRITIPNKPNTISPETRNRVITDVVEPGSTFKIVVVSGALNSGVVQLTINLTASTGILRLPGRVLHDHEAFGILSVKEIIRNRRTSARRKSASSWANKGFTITRGTTVSASAPAFRCRARHAGFCIR
jgi:hypothetical protein